MGHAVAKPFGQSDEQLGCEKQICCRTVCYQGRTEFENIHENIRIDGTAYGSLPGQGVLASKVMIGRDSVSAQIPWHEQQPAPSSDLTDALFREAGNTTQSCYCEESIVRDSAFPDGGLVREQPDIEVSGMQTSKTAQSRITRFNSDASYRDFLAQEAEIADPVFFGVASSNFGAASSTGVASQPSSMSRPSRVSKNKTDRSHNSRVSGISAMRQRTGQSEISIGESMKSSGTLSHSSKSRQTLLSRMHQEMIAKGCSEKNSDNEYEQLSVLKTSRRSLGAYGVGVQLYFEMLVWFGCLFFVMFLVNAPTLVFSMMGDLISHDLLLNSENVVYRYLGQLTIANLGSCVENDCRNQDDRRNRPLLEGSNVKLLDATPYLGALDGASVLLFVLTVTIFSFWEIPRAMRMQDDDHVTATDFSIHVEGLPARLPGDSHKQYVDAVKQHFKQLLTSMGVEYHESTAVSEVTLVRDYGGTIEQFMDYGEQLSQVTNAEELLRLLREENNLKKAKKVEKRLAKLGERVESIADKLKWQIMREHERSVYGAYVSFDKEDLKEAVLEAYSVYQHPLLLALQPKHLQFLNEHKLKVTQACEPTDVQWENLDYSKTKRRLRKAATWFITIGILFGATLGVTSITRAVRQKASSATTDDENVWVLMHMHENGTVDDTRCVRLCSFDVFSNYRCHESGKMSAVFYSTVRPNGTDEWAVDQNCNAQTSRSCVVDDPTWIATNPAGNQAPRCMRVSQFSTRPAEALALFACSSIQAFSWSSQQLDIHCRRFRDLNTEDGIGSAVMEDSKCEVPVRMEAAEVVKLKGGNSVNNPTLACYCAQQAAKSTKFLLPPHDTQEQQVCSEWIASKTSIWILMLIKAATVSSLNLIASFVFSYIDWFARHTTLTTLAQSQMSKLFFVQFMFTGIMVLLLTSSLDGPLSVLHHVNVGVGEFDDVGAAWFVKGGVGIILTIITQGGCATIAPLVMSFIVNPFFIRVFSRDLVTEETLGDVYILPEWNLALRLAQTMNIFFCVMLFSSGMPILLLIGALYCVLAYWLDKICLLRGSSQPPAYSEKLIIRAMSMMPIAALFHILLSQAMFGHQGLFPSKWSSLLSFAEWMYDMPLSTYEHIMLQRWLDNESYMEYMHARFLDTVRESSVLSSVILVSVLIYYVVVLFVRPLVRVSIDLIVACRRPKDPSDENILARKASTYTPNGAKMTEISHSEVQRQGSGIHMVMSYHIGVNRRYEDAYRALCSMELQHRKGSEEMEEAIEAWEQPTHTDERQEETSERVAESLLIKLLDANKSGDAEDLESQSTILSI